MRKLLSTTESNRFVWLFKGENALTGFNDRQLFLMDHTKYISVRCLCQNSHHPGGILAMFAYGGVRDMFFDLKFYLKAILWVKDLQYELPNFGGIKRFSNCHFFSIQFCNTSKIYL